MTFSYGFQYRVNCISNVYKILSLILNQFHMNLQRRKLKFNSSTLYSSFFTLIDAMWYLRNVQFQHAEMKIEDLLCKKRLKFVFYWHHVNFRII